MNTKLHWSPRSPFVRKVMIVLHETGQIDQVELVRNVVATFLPPNQAVMADNPLGKIPVLVENGRALFDSRVICEYLDARAGARLFPAELNERLRHLRWQAMADGLSDLLLVWRVELNRDGGPWPALTESYEAKVRATMAAFEAEADDITAAPFGIGHIALACALGQLDFRWAGCGWRERFPRLAALGTDLASRASVKATEVVDDVPAETTPHPLDFTQD